MRDELKQLYNAIDDTKTINGYTESELAELDENKMFEILKKAPMNKN